MKNPLKIIKYIYNSIVYPIPQGHPGMETDEAGNVFNSPPNLEKVMTLLDRHPGQVVHPYPDLENPNEPVEIWNANGEYECCLPADLVGRTGWEYITYSEQ